jgi:hypothetical protein
MTSPRCLYLHFPLQFMNQWTDFGEIWYERYVMREHTKRVFSCYQ